MKTPVISRPGMGALKELKFATEKAARSEAGPGVYDIHSPKIPGVLKIKEELSKMSEKSRRKNSGLILTAVLKQEEMKRPFSAPKI